MRKLASLFLAICMTIAACTPLPPPAELPPVSEGNWLASDLRWLGDGKSGQQPELEIAAVYARRSRGELQVRLDLLSFQHDASFDVYLALDLSPGGAQNLPISATPELRWEELLIFPHRSAPLRMLPGQDPLQSEDASLSVDAGLEAIILHLDERLLVNSMRFQLFLTPPGSQEPAARTPPLALLGQPPDPVPLLLAFWDALPADTPAQALRRWNGAHTGPLGQRHGLYQLLVAAERHDVPLALLDLVQPESLAALELMGQLDWIRHLASQGLLILPDPAPGDPEVWENQLAIARAAAKEYGFPASPFLFGPMSGTLPEGYRAAFYTGGDRLIPSGKGRLAPLPASIYSEQDVDALPIQIDRSGLTLETKRALLAASREPGRIVSLGGSLPASAWGDSSVAPAAFAYIQNHPWIQPLDAGALLAMPLPAGRNDPPPCADLLCAPRALPFIPYTTTGEPIASGLTLPELRARILSDLESVPLNAAGELAWRMYLELTRPSADPLRQALQANYLGQVGHLIYIAGWAAVPAPVSTCTLDLDYDGEPDCVLASSTVIATFKTDGGRLLFAGGVLDGDFAQWIGPGSQFRVGAGEARDWRIRLGAAGDPSEIPGAFAPAETPFTRFAPHMEPGSLTLRSLDGIEKRYELTPAGLRIAVQSPGRERTRLPLAAAPQQFWQPGGPAGYVLALLGPSKYQLTMPSGSALTVTVSADEVRVNSFLDSAALMTTSEDPEQEYPRGHFLPFPLVVFDLGSSGSLTVEIEQN